jgi:hypothetical protein
LPTSVAPSTTIPDWISARVRRFFRPRLADCCAIPSFDHYACDDLRSARLTPGLRPELCSLMYWDKRGRVIWGAGEDGQLWTTFENFDETHRLDGSNGTSCGHTSLYLSKNGCQSRKLCHCANTPIASI